MAGFFESIAARKAREPVLAAWMIEGPSAGANALFAWEGARYGEVYRDKTFPAACSAAIQNGPRGQEGLAVHDGARVFLEPMARRRRLVICGAGHVSLSVVKIGAMLNYEITVIDDREEFVQRAGAAGAHRAICQPFAEALDAVEGDLFTAFIIMTREHAHDLECLRRVLNKPCAYVGMMGSRSRTEQIRQRLLEEGFGPEAVQRAHMPIGLPIGSRTPEEIAVSVLAEVIQVMNASDASEGYPPGMLEALTAIESEPARRALLAMIVEKNGEAPRRPGTKLLMMADGRFLGTVGGGSAEAMILKAAGDMLSQGSRESRLVRIPLKKGTMFCGGEIEVFLLPLGAGMEETVNEAD